MSEIDNDDSDFTAKGIFDSLIDRCKKQKAITVYCYVDEEWVMKGVAKYDFRIKNGVFACTVICENEKEAQTIVANEMPVIKFIDKPEDYDN